MRLFVKFFVFLFILELLILVPNDSLHDATLRLQTTKTEHHQQNLNFYDLSYHWINSLEFFEEVEEKTEENFIKTLKSISRSIFLSDNFRNFSVLVRLVTGFRNHKFCACIPIYILFQNFKLDI